MKKIIILLGLSVALLSCTKEDTSNPPSNSTESLTSSLTIANGLRISEFIEEGVNETAMFSPYLFVFNTNGTVMATKTGHSINGTYLVFVDDNKTELMMTFPNNSELYELTDDWYFISQNGNTIRFEDSGDILQFEQQ